MSDQIFEDPALRERVSILCEEAGEVVSIIGKINRFGIESVNPTTGVSNRKLLEMELGHVLSAMDRMLRNGDLMSSSIHAAKEAKTEKIGLYLRYNQS